MIIIGAAMKELDVVKLTIEYNSIPAGTKGVIVLEYDETHFEVEFFDESGNTIDVLTTPIDILELVEALS